MFLIFIGIQQLLVNYIDISYNYVVKVNVMITNYQV